MTTEDLKVERNIPIPKIGVGHTKYPFPEMKVGDSVAVNGELKNRLRQAAFHYAKRHKPWSFKTRTVNGKMRLWRTK